jgi:hypothetical protein
MKLHQTKVSFSIKMVASADSAGAGPPPAEHLDNLS